MSNKRRYTKKYCKYCEAKITMIDYKEEKYFL